MTFEQKVQMSQRTNEEGVSFDPPNSVSRPSRNNNNDNGICCAGWPTGWFISARETMEVGTRKEEAAQEKNEEGEREEMR